jgi:16S rRNA (uracil1498-N3)-methyltransferase
MALAIDAGKVEIDGRAAEVADRWVKTDHALPPIISDNRNMIPRFFCPFPLHPGATVELAADAAHHALKVLRVGAGDTAILFDGRGGQWRATLNPAGKALRATLNEFDDIDREPPLALTLVQGQPAGDKMDLVVQKAVELGVRRIQPVTAKRSLVRLSGERAERRVAHWRNIAIAACEQSGRNRVPAIAPILDLPQYLGMAAQENGLRFVCAPGASESLRDLMAPSVPVSLLVGPEGGFDEGELLAARAAGFRPIGLGPRVLRTETAGLGALAAMMALWGDW